MMKSSQPWRLGTQEEADANEKARTTNDTIVPMFTLKQTMAMLNHTGRVVDIFKIDCEGCEWGAYVEWLNDVDLRQILVETHGAPMPSAKNFFYSLHDAGYVIFSKEANYGAGARAIEYAFLKMSSDFFLNNSTYSSYQRDLNSTRPH